jgi:small subunit ribosomal protein S8
MSMTDPVADMLTRIRNGIMASYDEVEVPSSKMKVSIAKILKFEGYIRNYKVIEGKTQARLMIHLKYGENKSPIIKGLERVSKPSCRVYTRCNKIPKVLNGLGINIVSTSKGVVTDREARKMGVGGEIICSVW